MREWLIGALRARVDDKGAAWLERMQSAAQAPVNGNDVLAAYAGASRRLGKKALAPDDAERTALESLAPDGVALEHWGLDEVGRACLLLSLTHLPPEDFAAQVLDCYEQGDSREQESWLRALCLLPEPERFLATAIDATRTNIIPLFEAIACENPYPARYFPELNFNQLVLKCLFTMLPLARIVGLEERGNADLSRMADDYVSEREAAGRAVPTDIWWVVAPHADPQALARVVAYLGHEDPAHRYWAARGLARVPHGEDGVLRRRLESETHPQVREAIESALTHGAAHP